MNKKSMKKRPKKGKKKDHFLFELLSWIPELLILPFRFIIYIARALARFIMD